MGFFSLAPSISSFFAGQNIFDQILQVNGEVYRTFANRRTVRVELGGRGYFFKIHLGVGWKEILKCLFSFRLPILGAKNEWLAIQRLKDINVETMTIVGFGTRGWNPANRQSFLITEELTDTISLEDLCADWKTGPPPVALKRTLIEKVARIAGQLHSQGVNHRDFYICHFLLKINDLKLADTFCHLKLYVIDLHRAQIRKKVPERWLVKDLAGLFFSSMDLPLSRNDIYRFLLVYYNTSLREILNNEQPRLSRVLMTAEKQYQKFHGTPPCHPFQ